jgi:hypothetical protein
MKNSGTFNITAHGDREIVVTRRFNAHGGWCSMLTPSRNS